MSSRRVPPGVFILRSFQLTLAAAVASASLWGLLGGCREQSTAPIDRNRPPETWLTDAPGDSQVSFYRVPLYWSGSDHDGIVVAYEVAVTESLPHQDDIRWRRTTRSDSLVTIPVEEAREVLGHRFYVRAVDNEGKVDPTPAWVFFGVRDIFPPVVQFYRALATGPNGETKELTSSNPGSPTDTIPTGWGVTFAWSGYDADVAIDSNGQIVQVGSVTKYSYRMLPVESEFLGGTLGDTTRTYEAAFFNSFPKGNIYAFDVRAVDDAGLSGAGAVTRSFVWNRDPVSRISRCYHPVRAESVACFQSRDSTFFSGDTLALPSGSEPLPNVSFTSGAYDPDPTDGDHSVASIEWRHISGAIINMWRRIDPGTPAVLENLPSGDYMAMVRSVDRLGRVEATPDSVLFYVNFAPRFITQKEGFEQTPMPGDIFTATDLRSNGLQCQFLVENPDAFVTERVRYGIRFEGPMGREVRFHHRMSLFEGTSYGVVALRDSTWRTGNYVLYVLAEDNKQSGGETRGIRSRERAVRFTVMAQ